MNETPFLHLMELEIENTLCTRVSEKMRQHPTVEAGHCVLSCFRKRMSRHHRPTSLTGKRGVDDWLHGRWTAMLFGYCDYGSYKVTRTDSYSTKSHRFVATKCGLPTKNSFNKQ